VDKLDTFCIEHIQREDNQAANRMDQQASGYNVKRGKFRVGEGHVLQDIMNMDGDGVLTTDEGVSADWRTLIRECIMKPEASNDRKIHRQTLKYTVIGDELYRRTIDGCC
jgi:hypothetical protein